MSTLTRSSLRRAVEAHVHHEGRRRGDPLTFKEWTRKIKLKGEGQTFSDWKAGRMPAGMRRELDTEDLLRREVERGVAELEAELAGVFTGKTSRNVVKKLARVAARHLYGLEGGDR